MVIRLENHGVNRGRRIMHPPPVYFLPAWVNPKGLRSWAKSVVVEAGTLRGADLRKSVSICQFKFSDLRSLRLFHSLHANHLLLEVARPLEARHGRRRTGLNDEGNVGTH